MLNGVRVTLLCMLACMLNATVRSASLVVVPLGVEYNLTLAQRGTFLAGFSMGYVPTILPSGVIAHRFGGAPQISVCLLLNALVWAITPLVLPSAGTPGNAAAPLTVLVWSQVLTGAASGLLNPALHSLISVWISPAHRSGAHNLIYSGQAGGQMLSLGIGGYVLQNWGWRSLFFGQAACIGTFGLVWLCVMRSKPLLSDTAHLVPDTAAGVKTISSEGLKEVLLPGEEEERQSSPWETAKAVMTAKCFWAIMVNHFAFDYFAYTLGSWGPSWLMQRFGLSLSEAGVLSVLPALSSMLVTLGSGAAISIMLGRNKAAPKVGVMTRVRKVNQAIGMLVPAAIIFLLPTEAKSVGTAVLLLVVASAASGLCMSGHHVNHIDLCPRLAPILYGVTNTFANTSGIFTNLLSGAILDEHKSTSDAGWQTVFYVSSAIQASGGILYVAMASGELQPWSLVRPRCSWVSA
jgi:ACS family sodium-dependent inorganic phosphate cotransporter